MKYKYVEWDDYLRDLSWLLLGMNSFAPTPYSYYTIAGLAVTICIRGIIIFRAFR